MSAKYERIKQADLALPAPLRWVMRALSSITLAVILLTAVALYGTLGATPVYLLTLGGLYALALGAALGIAALVIWGVVCLPNVPRPVRAIVTLAALGGAGWLAYELCVAGYTWASQHPWLSAHRGLTVHHLRMFEMTTQEWFAWWPMQTLLIVFVINMIVATVRRIAFRFVNLGVLTVHTGIVVLALGAVLYGHFKVEGDTLLYRDDLGGRFRNTFYDATDQALYVSTNQQEAMLPLSNLPRFNDYALGELNIALHDRAEFQQQFGDRLRLSIPGFIAAGRMTTQWTTHSDISPKATVIDTSPALRLRLGDATGPNKDSPTETLIAGDPAERVMRGRSWAVEYLHQPTPERLRDLRSRFAGRHGLVVQVPGQNYRDVFAIQPGQTIQAGDTGYTLTIENIGPYNMPFASEGYEAAQDTRAVVRVEGNGKQFRRIVMHRYPQRSQDFVPSPNNANTPPMGERQAPDPAIRLAYLDNTRAQYHLFVDGDALRMIVRLGDGHTMQAGLPDGRIPLPGGGETQQFAHVTRRIPDMVRVREPTPIPEAQRDPEDEGKYLQALLPVRIGVDLPKDEGGGTWSRLVWLHHMQYPHLPEGANRPVTVRVPSIGDVQLAFSRLRHRLPFAMKLDAFTMTPYPGSNIPRDFESRLLIADLTDAGALAEAPTPYRAHLNNPITYHPDHAPLHLGRVMISQAGWDPPRDGDPNPDAKNAQGKLINQQRYTIVGIGNNVGFYIVFTGGSMIVLGIPWAFWVKPALVRRQTRKLQQALTIKADAPERAAATDQQEQHTQTTNIA